MTNVSKTVQAITEKDRNGRFKVLREAQRTCGFGAAQRVTFSWSMLFLIPGLAETLLICVAEAEKVGRNSAHEHEKGEHKGKTGARLTTAHGCSGPYLV